MKIFTFFNYIFVSHAFVLIYLINAFSTNDNFYGAVQSLTIQKPAVVALYNYCFIIFVGICELILILFFGELRHLEIEQALEQVRGFFMDALLFLVLSKPLINGKEMDTLKVFKGLSCLVVLKAYHLILYIRSSHIFQSGIPRMTTILRNLAVMYILILIDISLIYFFYSLSSVKSTFYVWLFFEFIGMFHGIVCCICKFMVNLTDIILIYGLSQKQTYIFYLDLLHDLISLFMFLGFIVIFFLLNPTTLPLYMVVDVLQVVRNLSTRISTLLKYRKLTKIIEIRFPNATEEQIREQDTCIICREKLDETCKSLDCSHVFHYQCLKSWLIHQISCPMCRTEITYRDPVQILEELDTSENADNILKKAIEKDETDPFENFDINFPEKNNEKVSKEELLKLEKSDDIKNVYQELINTFQSSVELIKKLDELETEKKDNTLNKITDVLSKDQSERCALISELPEIKYEAQDGTDDNSQHKYDFADRYLIMPVRIRPNPSHIALILGYKMRVIDCMVKGIKELNT